MVCMLGQIGVGKTYNLIHILEYLSYIAAEPPEGVVIVKTGKLGNKDKAIFKIEVKTLDKKMLKTSQVPKILKMHRIFHLRSTFTKLDLQFNA